MEHARIPNPLAKADGLDGASFSHMADEIDRAIERPFWSLRFSLKLGLILWAVPCLALAWLYLPTFEGRTFDILFKIGFFLASLGIVAASAQAYTLWTRMHALFGRLSVHPIAIAFGALPERISRRMHDSLYAYIPSIDDQEFILRWWRRLAREYKACPPAPVGATLEPSIDPKLERVLSIGVPSAENILLEARRGGGDAEANAPRRLQAYFTLLAMRLLETLRPIWDQGLFTRDAPKAAATDDHATEKEAKGASVAPTDPFKVWFLDAEEFVATQIVTYVGQVFRHIRNLLAFVTVGLLLLLLTVPAYPFQPQRLLNMFVWGLVLIVVSGALWVSVQMNRSEVLSRMTGTTPNRVTFNRTLMRDVGVYVGLPLLSLLATQFPSIGGSLFSWVEPALRAMK